MPDNYSDKFKQLSKLNQLQMLYNAHFGIRKEMQRLEQAYDTKAQRHDVAGYFFWGGLYGAWVHTRAYLPAGLVGLACLYLKNRFSPAEPNPAYERSKQSMSEFEQRSSDLLDDIANSDTDAEASEKSEEYVSHEFDSKQDEVANNPCKPDPQVAPLLEAFERTKKHFHNRERRAVGMSFASTTAPLALTTGLLASRLPSIKPPAKYLGYGAGLLFLAHLAHQIRTVVKSEAPTQALEQQGEAYFSLLKKRL